MNAENQNGGQLAPLTCIVSSSHGNLKIDSVSGSVLLVSLHESEPDADARFLNCITRFDVEEWVKTYNKPLPGQLDILDLGYYYTRNEDGVSDYEDPAHDWRIETAECRNQDNGNGYHLLNF